MQKKILPGALLWLWGPDLHTHPDHQDSSCQKNRTHTQEGPATHCPSEERIPVPASSFWTQGCAYGQGYLKDTPPNGE